MSFFQTLSKQSSARYIIFSKGLMNLSIYCLGHILIEYAVDSNPFAGINSRSIKNVDKILNLLEI